MFKIGDNPYDVYLVTPVCHANKNITISTNALIQASYDAGRPDDKAEFKNTDNGNFTISKIKIPGYLYIHFSAD